MKAQIYTQISLHSSYKGTYKYYKNIYTKNASNATGILKKARVRFQIRDHSTPGCCYIH